MKTKPNILEPVAILPSQFAKDRQFTGEEALLIAVLNDSVRVLGNRPGDPDEIDWLAGRNQSPGTIPFADICRHFGVDPDETSRRIIAGEARWECLQRDPACGPTVGYRDHSGPRDKRKRTKLEPMAA